VPILSGDFELRLTALAADAARTPQEHPYDRWLAALLLAQAAAQPLAASLASWQETFLWGHGPFTTPYDRVLIRGVRVIQELKAALAAGR
jgi:hypothetical protein